MRLLVLDNYDSFTYNLVHMLEQLGYAGQMDVYRNDEIALDDVEAYDKILLSPGPGIPSEAGIMMDLIKRYAPTKSILGVCLGHQGIGECFGSELRNMKTVQHGLASTATLIKRDELFDEVPEHIQIAHYHSWVVDQQKVGHDLEITAVDESGQIMAMRHKHLDVRGVQFHPESVLTEYGYRILFNWVQGDDPTSEQEELIALKNAHQNII